MGDSARVSENNDDDTERVVVYELQRSMWDAALLLVLRHMSLADQIIIIAGVVFNAGLQLVLLLVIFFDMLEDPIDDVMEGVVHWRAFVGHEAFKTDMTSGQTLVEGVCNMNRWSFETEAYKDLREYLYQPMPGWSLSAVALTLWLITVGVEIRAVLDQIRLLYHLPTSGSKDQDLCIRVGHHYEVQGLRFCGKVGVMTLLCLPRLAAAVCLAVVGCSFVAKTVSLSDIVLNSVALAFVMDVDELIASLFLSRPIQILLDRIQPIACGKRKVAAGRFEDIMRCLFAVVCILGACLYWLHPFLMQVRLASNILCGGNHNFSYNSMDQPGIPFMNNDEFRASCTAEVQEETSKALGLNNFTLWGRVPPVDSKSIGSAVLNYAFAGCEAGHFMDAGRDCQPITENMMQVLPLAEEKLPQWPSCVNTTAGICGEHSENGPCWYPWAAIACNFLGPTRVRSTLCPLRKDIPN